MSSIGDVSTIIDLASRVDANPVRLAGRTLGLSADEQQAGVPKLAVLGGVAMLSFAATIVVVPALVPSLRRRR